ncbi:hypothetical protein ANN_10256 [Periplaneta americana]|uniref:Uncharacterized protein n=1 Tax=Periplaneta americana TaxID=6978 RepID=A0ABQ8TNT8_PERAM|nr:hypothetical protein ANN_10256 [Periplaneta americana]
MEHHNIRAESLQYLRKIKKYREEGRSIFYMDDNDDDNDDNDDDERENVMIYGIPVTKSESLYEVNNTISKVTGAENFGQDVSVAHRLPSQKGETMFNLPPLDPFEMKELKLSDGQGRGQVNLTMRDVKLLGLKDAYLQNYSEIFVKWDQDSQIIRNAKLSHEHSLIHPSPTVKEMWKNINSMGLTKQKSQVEDTKFRLDSLNEHFTFPIPQPILKEETLFRNYILILYDFNTGHASFLFTIPQLTLLGTYNISEYILMLPISGTGNINITLDNMAIHGYRSLGGPPPLALLLLLSRQLPSLRPLYRCSRQVLGEIHPIPPAAAILVDKKFTIRYYISKEKINGVDHALLTSSAVHLDSKRMYIHLDNLFDGDKRLGDEIHKLLDENWKEVFYEITPHIAASIIEVFTGMMNGITKQIPYDLLAPETLS